MTESPDERNPIDVLADEFLERYRRGEHPPLSEYAERHPDLAEEIHDLFPVLLAMEGARSDGASHAATSDGATGETALPPLRQLGDYRIIREAGRGGMGIVYEAEQISLGRRVALKVLPQQMLISEKNRQRFEREARAAARLHHTNIVPVFGIGEAEGYHFYMMQFIHGLGLDEVVDELRRMNGKDSGSGTPSPSSLKVVRRSDVSAADVAKSLVTGEFDRAVLAADELQATSAGSPTRAEPAGSGDGDSPTSNSQPTSEASTVSSSSTALLGGERSQSNSGRRRRRHTYWLSVADVGRQVAEALDYAHRQGILHRDIKPSNLLLDLRGTVWVTDFGLAKASDQDNLTNTGDILGTFRYIPPEAFEGKVDVRGDVYSLGVTLYELLALRPAFDEQDRGRLIKQVTTAEPTRLDKVNPQIPRDLVTIVHKAIDRDPRHRYRTSKDLADDLERFILDEPIRARRSTAWERTQKWARRNRPIVWSLASVAALLMVGMMVVTAVTLRERANTARQRDVAQAQRNLARQAVDKMFTQVAEQWLSQKMSLEPLQEQFLQEALDFYTELAQEESDNPQLRLEMGNAYRRIAAIRFKTGKFEEAEVAFEQASEILEKLVEEHLSDAHFREALATNYHEYAYMLRFSDRTRRAGDWYQRAYDQRKILAEMFPDVNEYRRDMALSLGGVGSTLRRAAAAAEAYRQSLDIATSLPAEVWQKGHFQHELGMLNFELTMKLRWAGSHTEDSWQFFDRSQEIYQRLVDRFPSNPVFRNELAWSHLEAGRHRRHGTLEAAETSFLKAIEIEAQIVRESPTVPDYQYVLGLAHVGLGKTYLEAGQHENAVATFERSIELLAALMTQNPGLRPQLYGDALNDACIGIARARSDQNSDEVNEAILLEALVAVREIVGDVHYAVGNLLHDLGKRYAKVGNFEAAQEAFRESLSIRRLVLDDDDPNLGWAFANMSWMREHHGDLERCERLRREALSIFQRIEGQEDVVADHQLWLGNVLFDRAQQSAITSDFTAAAERYEEALQLYVDSGHRDAYLHWNWYRAAVLAAYLNDNDQYEFILREMTKQFSESTDPWIVERVAKSCMLLPSANYDPEVIANLEGVAEAAEANAGLLPWYQLARGMAEYRTGRLEESIDWLGQSRKSAPDNQRIVIVTQCFRAMAQYQLGHVDEAKASYSEGRQLLDEHIPAPDSGALGDDWFDVLVCHLAQRETESVVDVDIANRAATAASDHPTQTTELVD